LSIHRVIISLFLDLLYQRQGPYRLIWPLLHLKPPRLTKVRTKAMSRNQKMRLARRHRLPPHLLRRLLSTRKGNALMRLLHQVLWQLVKPPLLQKISSTMTC
jgi:hypothetical protein